MKKFLSLAAIAALMACFASCGSDDKEEDEPVVITEISVSPSSATFEAEGGTANFAVTTNAATYAVSKDADWLTVQQSGKEVTLTAAENTVNQQRTATVTLAAGNVTCTIAVTQKPGSPYRGYTIAQTCKYEYAGTMLYQFLKPAEGYDGGQGYLELADEDGNSLSLWIYTTLAESEEQVELNLGTYTPGEDAYPSLVAKKMTFVKGIRSDVDDDESFIMGCFYTDAIAGKDIALVDGQIEVAEGLVKVDMKDADGNDYKYVYEGEVTIDASGATYPSAGDEDRIDVANTVFAAQCYYLGDKYENGTTTYQLLIYSGDEENYAVTTYEFIGEAAEYSADLNFTGDYISPAAEGEEGLAPYSAGTIINGSLMEFGDFSFPMGTYVMYSFGDYLIGDAYNSLMITKGDDGKYTFMGAIMDTESNMVFFMTPPALEIPVIDATAEED